MRYGDFSADGREFIMHSPELPKPWINYITNGSYCGLVSHTGGGYSFWQSSGFERITKKYPEETLLQDRPGRYIYLRDADSGEYWSLNWQPVCRNPVEWESRHGLGYTYVRSGYNGITGQVTYFVPLNDDLEIWWVRIRNDSHERRRLQSFDFVEWSMGNPAQKLLESSFSKLFEDVRNENDIIYGTMRFWDVSVAGPQINPNTAWNKYAFMAASLRPDAFECLKEQFVGYNRDWSAPRAVVEGACGNGNALGRFSVGAFQHDLDLEGGEEVEYAVMVGIVREKEEAVTLRKRYSDLGNVSRALADVRSYWDRYLDKLTVETPEADFDLSTNIWTKYQAWVTSHWARMDSYYIGGGSIIGFRDACQDLLGILPMEPERARLRLITLLEHQFSDGSCIHNWDPVSDTGPKTAHSDDPLWLVMAIVEYIKETGHLAFADLEVDYYDGRSDTVANHLYAALNYTLSSRSSRGLPLIGSGDWNDGLDQVGRQGYGESAMVAEHLVWMLREAEDLCRTLGRKADIHNFGLLAEDISRRVNQLCWDGEWYIRATADDGRVLGSRENAEGCIYLNTQSWAVMSGVADEERGKVCMDAVAERLETDYGPALFLPAYSVPDPGIGIITRFVPGVKENGTIFNHPVCWAVIAECILGRGDRAWDIWRRSSLVNRMDRQEDYKAEPYIYAEYVYGPDSAYHGEGEFTWTTGTAAWMFRACTDWILGVRPQYGGLLVDPCLPTNWKRCRVKRDFRGATYDISIENDGGVSRGVEKLIMDGEEVEGRVLPDRRDGGVHRVQVIMRSSA